MSVGPRAAQPANIQHLLASTLTPDLHLLLCRPHCAGWGPLWTFTMGWMNLIAQVAGNAAQTALLGDLTITFVDMFCAWLEVEAPEFSKGASYGIYAAWTIIASGLK
jgi:hypothetical protein